MEHMLAGEIDGPLVLCHASLAAGAICIVCVTSAHQLENLCLISDFIDEIELLSCVERLLVASEDVSDLLECFL
jgi:hypothetical protein